MLSVLSTPCTKPSACHLATSAPVRRATSRSSAVYSQPPPLRRTCGHDQQPQIASVSARFIASFHLDDGAAPLHRAAKPGRLREEG